MIVLYLFCIGCDSKNEIQDYKVQKHKVKIQNNKQVRNKKLAWTQPGNWHEKEASGMRLANFIIKNKSDKNNAECYVFVFSGDGGGVIPNIKRWYSQMNKKFPGPKAALDKSLSLKIAHRNAILVDIKGVYKKLGIGKPHTNYRMLGTIIQTNKNTIFIKFIGPTSIISKEYQNYLTFCKSIRITGAF